MECLLDVLPSWRLTCRQDGRKQVLRVRKLITSLSVTARSNFQRSILAFAVTKRRLVVLPARQHQAGLAFLGLARKVLDVPVRKDRQEVEVHPRAGYLAHPSGFGG